MIIILILICIIIIINLESVGAVRDAEFKGQFRIIRIIRVIRVIRVIRIIRVTWVIRVGIRIIKGYYSR